MTTYIRLTAAVAAVGSALVLATGASAAVTPRLEANTSADSQTTLKFSASGDDLAKLVMTVPAEYLASYSDVPGAEVGKVTASVQSGKLTGTVVAAAATDPATVNGAPSTLGAAAALCRGTPAPAQAYWMLKLSGGGQTLDLPVFADFTFTSAFAPFASSSLTACLPAGTKLTSLTLTLDEYTAPAPGRYLWHALATPFAAGTTTVNDAGAAEAQGLDATPGELTIASARRVNGGVRVTGKLTQGAQGVSGQTVKVAAGKRVAKAKTLSGGRFTVTLSKVTASKVTATATVAARAGSCHTARFAPAPCASATIGGFSVAADPVSIRR
jgi:hypothetical protein